MAKTTRRRNNSDSAKTALVYCRVSTRNQQEEGTSLETQAEACRKHAESLGYRVGKVTKEVYSGAELWERPELTKVRAAIMAGEYRALIVYALDRLSREQNAVGLIACECLRGDCELISVTENLDDSAQGKFLRSGVIFAAELEREKIRERTMRGRHARLREGKPGFGGWQLYGYTPNKEENRYEVVEAEALIVRRVFDLCASGSGCHAIASLLNREGIPSPKAGRRGNAENWSAATLYRIFKNESYKGEEFQWKTKRDKYKRDRPRPAAERISLPAGTRPAIIAPEVWQIVQERLKSNAGAATRNQANPVLLRGLIFCGNCGSPMIRNRYKRGNYQYDKYRCGSHWRPFATDCKAKAIDVEDCNEWVWSNVRRVFENPSIIERELQRLKDTSGDPELDAQLGNLKRELARAESDIQALLRQFRKSSEAVRAAVEREVNAAAKEKEVLEDAIDRLEQRLGADKALLADMKSLKAYCRKVDGELGGLPFDKRRLALTGLGVRIEGNGLDWKLELKVLTNPATGDVTVLRVSANEQQSYIPLTICSQESRMRAA